MSAHILGDNPVGADITINSGTDGSQGTAGIQGAQGAQGRIGTSGVNGAQGIQGLQGPQATDGVQGIQGIAGSNGLPGNRLEYQYAKNSSMITGPSIVRTDLNPTGWSTLPPTLGATEYLWMTQSAKNFGGSILITNWTIPVRISGSGSNSSSGFFISGTQSTSGDLAATFQIIPMAQTPEGLNRQDYIQFTGSGGMAIVSCNGAQGIAYYSYSTKYGSAQSLMNTRDDFITNNLANFLAVNVELTPDGDHGIALIGINGQASLDFDPPTDVQNVTDSNQGSIAIYNNDIFEPYADNSLQSAVKINMVGFDGGTEYARNLVIGNGQGIEMIRVDGYNKGIWMTLPYNDPPGGTNDYRTGYLYIDANGFVRWSD